MDWWERASQGWGTLGAPKGVRLFMLGYVLGFSAIFPTIFEVNFLSLGPHLNFSTNCIFTFFLFWPIVLQSVYPPRVIISISAFLSAERPIIVFQRVNLFIVLYAFLIAFYYFSETVFVESFLYHIYVYFSFIWYLYAFMEFSIIDNYLKLSNFHIK